MSVVIDIVQNTKNNSKLYKHSVSKLNYYLMYFRQPVSETVHFFKFLCPGSATFYCKKIVSWERDLAVTKFILASLTRPNQFHIFVYTMEQTVDAAWRQKCLHPKCHKTVWETFQKTTFGLRRGSLRCSAQINLSEILLIVKG